MKLSLALLAAILALAPAPLLAQSDVSRVNEPAAGKEVKAYRNSAIITAFDTRNVQTREAGRMVTQGFKRKLFHISRETGMDAGTPVYHDRGDWWCTERDNYYAGGGRFGRLCLRDADNDGAFERVRMGRGLLMRTLDPPVVHSEYQARSESQPTGLKKGLIYRGRDANNLKIEYVEYIRSEHSPAVSRMITVPFSGNTGRIVVEGVTFAVSRAAETSIDYTIIAGTL